MTVNDFLKKYHRQAVYCNSFYIQFYSYLKNEMDIEFKCKLFKDERGTDMNILYKYSSCKVKNFSIKSFFTCYPQGNREEIFITLSIYLNPKDLVSDTEFNPEDEIFEFSKRIVL